MLTAEDAAAIAVNEISVSGDGFELAHPSHHARFGVDGVAVSPVRGGPEWRWSLAEIRIDGAFVAPESRAPLHPSRDRIVYQRGPITERYLLRRGCVEQQFVVHAPPARTTDDIEIIGHVTCDAGFSRTETGWSWRDTNGEVHLGDVTVFDAVGTRLTAKMTVTHERTRIMVDGQDLARATYPVTIDPEIGANDFRISAMGPEFAGRATQPAIAYSQTHEEYLVVWAGHHKMAFPSTNHFDIYGQFIDALTGERIGTEALVISETAPNGDPSFSGATGVDVVYNSDDDEYLVVWCSDHGGGGMVAGESEVFVQRIDGVTRQELGADVRVSDMGPNGKFSYDAVAPSVTYDSTGNTYLVVWSGSDAVAFEFDIYGQRLTGATAAEIGSNDFRISDMGPNGSTSYFGGSPDALFNPTANEFLVAWSGSDNTLGPGESEIWVQRIDAATGAEVGANDLRITEISDGVALGKAASPSVAYNLVANQYLVVFSAETPSDGIYGQRLAGSDAAQVGVSDFAVSALLTDPQGVPTACFNASTSEYLVTWLLGRPSESQTLGQRLTSSGVETGPDDFSVSQHPAGAFQVGFNDVVHASGPNEFYCVWEFGLDGGIGTSDAEELYAQRLTAAGTETGTNDRRLTGMGENCFDAFRPAVAYNPTDREYLVVWSGDHGVDTLVDGEFEIYGQLIDAVTGMEIGLDDVRISATGVDGNAEADAIDPAVAFHTGSGAYIVVWSADPATGGLAVGESEIFGRKVAAQTGVPAGGPDLRFSEMGGTGTNMYVAQTPAIEARPDGYLIVWRGDDNTPSLVDNDFEIFGQLTTAEGVKVGGHFRISDMGPSGNTQLRADPNPDVTYSATHDEFFVVWFGDDGTPPLVDNEFEIFGQRIDATSGLEVGANDIRLSDMGPDGTSLYSATSPAVAYNAANDEYLVVWSGDDDAGGLVEGKVQVFGQRVAASTGSEVGENDSRVSQSGADDDDGIDASGPDIAWDANANQYLVVWAGEDDTAPHVDGKFEVFGQVLDGLTGTEVGSDFPLSDMGPPSHVDFDAFWPAISAAPGLGMLIAWEGDDSADDRFDNESEIFGQMYSLASSSVVGESLDETGARSWLRTAVPNPTSGAFSVSMSLNRRSRVRASLVNVQGRVVARFVEQWVEAGDQTIAFDPPAGRLANGVYVLHVEAGARSGSRKIFLIQ